MLRVPIDQAAGNMVLARAVHDPSKPAHILLKSGYKLSSEDIKRLRSLYVNSVWVQYPNLDFLDELIDPVLTQQQHDVCDCIKSQFTQSQELSLAGVDYSQYHKQISAMYVNMVDHQKISALFINELFGASQDIFRHGTTVAYLAMIIGMRLESYLIKERPQLPKRTATDLVPLGVGCLLHDLGKLLLPADMQYFKLSALDLGEPQWQQHTEVGYDMVKGGLDSSAAQVVLNHHQHFDGTGFPLRKSSVGTGELDLTLAGNDIHIFCRIAALADRFDNFRFASDGREVPNIIALKRLQNPGYAKWFDPMVYQAFIEVVPPFVPGLQVTLNNGQTCVIKEVNLKAPCRPTLCPIDIEQAINPQTTTSDKPPEDIYLEKVPDLHIAQVGSFDVTKYLY